MTARLTPEQVATIARRIARRRGAVSAALRLSRVAAVLRDLGLVRGVVPSVDVAALLLNAADDREVWHVFCPACKHPWDVVGHIPASEITCPRCACRSLSYHQNRVDAAISCHLPGVFHR